jgi:hypothetical protein
MATVITRSAHPDMLWPGVLEIFGLNYEEFPDIWPKYFDRIEGELATERLIEATGFGLARTKTEGAPITYDTDAEGYATLATPAVVGLGYQVTREELEDGLYTEVSLPRAESLAFSEHITIELIHANMFLNGFSTSYKFGDGQPIFSASHPTKSGNQSNLNGQSATAADISEASLEDMIKQIYLAKNSRGLQINIRPVQIMVSAADMFNTTRILESQLRTNTANNDINAIKQMGLIPEGVLVNPYLGVETTQSWYVQTSVQKRKGAVSIWRRDPELERDNDFDTENAKAKTTARFVPSMGDWRAWYANQGV